LMEVTLSNRRGELVGRRTFRPQEYLTKKIDKDEFMVPNVIIRAEIEFTNPARQPEGFEIRLLPDSKRMETS
jgi:hypothetical protein